MQTILDFVIFYWGKPKHLEKKESGLGCMGIKPNSNSQKNIEIQLYNSMTAWQNNVNAWQNNVSVSLCSSNFDI